MRAAIVLCLLLSPVLAAEGSLASKFPAGASAYLEVTGLASKIEAALASPLGTALKQHPALAMALATPDGQEFEQHLARLKEATGFDGAGLLRALVGKRLAVAAYGAPQHFALMARMSAQEAERLVAGTEKIVGLKRRELLPEEQDAPAMYGFFHICVFFDGDCLVVSPDRLLATAMRARVAKGMDSDKRYVEAREAAGAEAALFGYVDLKTFAKRLERYDKPKELGEAVLLGAFAHYLPKAPWAAFKLDLVRRGERWSLVGESFLPVPEPQLDGPVEKSYRGTLDPLPFALPERTVGVIRMRRRLASIWSNREELIARKGIPGLVQFETNFGNLAGGLSWVEEVLPNLGDELIVVGTRRVFARDKPAPAVHFPQGAVLLPLSNAAELGDKLQIAFNNTIAILNIDQGMMGYNLLATATEYKGVRILQASYMSASKGEMEGRQSLPPRFNLAPACATVGDYFVVASHGDIIREIIDSYGKAGAAPEGVNAGVWLRPREVRTLLAENREPLIANAMLEDGIGREEAEGRIDLLLDLAGYVRSFEITSREGRGTLGLRLGIGLQAPAETVGK